MGIKIVDRGRFGQRPLYRGLLDSENARVSRANDHKGR